MSTLSLAQQVSTEALGSVAAALPSSLADKVITSQVEQLFVWVVKDLDNAAKIVSILQENGFKNIKVDSKGTTITALGGGLLNNVAPAPVAPAPVDPAPVDPAPAPTSINASAAKTEILKD